MSALEVKLVKCTDPADPNRCQTMDGQGQCPFVAVEGAIYCAKHRGGVAVKNAEKQKVHDYRLQIWQQRMDEFTASDQIKNLTGEIGVLRMTLEQTINQCKDVTQLMMFSHKIQSLVLSIEKVVATCTKLESRQGNLLDKSQAIVFAGQIVETISRHVTDPAAIDAISSEIIDFVAKLAGKEMADDG
jgi:hypothetical protein